VSRRVVEPNKASEPQYGAGYKLIGKNYTTADLHAKVTGKAKYAEDYRAEGMLFCKLLLSPLPHARIKRIDASKALAMPGVRAILTADDLPAPADTLTDNGTVIKASKWGERGLTMEPLYQGEPILAVAAADELTAAEAIERIHIDFERLPFVIDPLDTLRPGGPNPRTDGNIWVTPPGGSAPAVAELKWTDADFAETRYGRLPMGKTPDQWSYGDLDAGFKNAALVLDETFVTPDVSHQTLEPRSAMAYWQNGKVYVHSGTQSTFQTLPALARWLNIDPGKVVFISEYTGGGFGSKVTGGVTMIIPALLSKKANAPVMMRISREEETFIGRARPGFQGRMKVGFCKEGRIAALDMFVVSDNGPYDAQGRSHVRSHGLPVVPAASHALARGDGIDEYATTQCAELTRRPAGNCHHRTDHRQSCAQTRFGPGGHPPHQLSRGQGGVWTAGAGQAAARDQRFHKGCTRSRRGAVPMAEAGGAQPEADRLEGARRRRIPQLLRRRHHRVRRTSGHHARWPGPLPVRNRQSGNGVRD